MKVRLAKKITSLRHTLYWEIRVLYEIAGKCRDHRVAKAWKVVSRNKVAQEEDNRHIKYD